MDELNALLRPAWGGEKWILQCWNNINSDEKKTIQKRMDSLFKNGLPFELNHDRLSYVYMFSMVAQFEILGLQAPMIYGEKLTNPHLRQLMRAQLVDEIFHALALTKILYLLCSPYNSPPALDPRIQDLCDFVKNQDCPKMGLVLLNLICESWLEGIFKNLYENNIAPAVFKTILEDEQRHVCEADLYREVGLPKKAVLIDKLGQLEKLILNIMTFQPQYGMAFTAILGPKATQAFLRSLDEKYNRQLKKINMVPSKLWTLGQEIFAEFEPYRDEINAEGEKEIYEVEMTPMKKAFMTQWDNPGDPTMVCQFNIDVSCLDFFGKKYPAETMTTLMTQAVSQFLTSDDAFRSFLSYKKLYQTRSTYVSLVVKLPHCGDHVGQIVFKDCHKMNVQEMSVNIRRVLHMMVYCYTKREQLEKNYPHLKRDLDNTLYAYAEDIFPYPVPGNPVVSVSNIGVGGYTHAKSPLRKHSALQVTLLSVDRKPVWSSDTQSFEAKDLLPVSISADHRVFEGQLPYAKLMRSAFQTVFQQMIDGSSQEPEHYITKIDGLSPEDVDVIAEKMARSENNKKIVERILAKDIEFDGQKVTKYSDFKEIADKTLLEYLDFNAEKAKQRVDFTKIVDKMLAENLEMGHRVLAVLQNVWFDFVDVEEVYNTISKKMASSKLAAMID